MTHQLTLFTAEYPEVDTKGAVGAVEGGLPSSGACAVSKDGGKDMRSASAVIEKVITMLPSALDRVLSNKGAAGPDGIGIDLVKQHRVELLLELSLALRQGSFTPGLTRRVWIPKQGGQRALGIPNVVDRVVQTAMSMVLEPECEARFHSNSHGFRPGRSCHTAIRQARDFVAEGYRWVVDIDLEKFFDQVNHQRLLARLAQIEPDYELLKLVGQMLKAKTVMPDGLVQANEKGVPQGGPLSALLSNIVLNELDWKLQERGHKFVRYADDLKIYVRSERAGQRVMASVRQFIVKTLRLRVNEAKSAVARPRERHFVGFRLEEDDDEEVEIRLSKRSSERLRHKIVQLTPRNWGSSLSQCIKGLNSYLGGWFEFFQIVGEGEHRFLCTMDAHIRRRLRAIMLKHWKCKRTIARKLIQRGARPRNTWQSVYGRRRSLWALSVIPVVNRTIGIAFFIKEKGLVSLGDKWTRKHSRITASGQYMLPGIV